MFWREAGALLLALVVDIIVTFSKYTIFLNKSWKKTWNKRYFLRFIDIGTSVRLYWSEGESEIPSRM